MFNIRRKVEVLNPTQPPLAQSFPDVQPTQVHESRHSWEGSSHVREMFGLMSGPWKSPQWGYLVSFGWLPPTCLNSISTGLLGGARSSGCLPSEFLREWLAPWLSRTDTNSGLESRAAMCRGESPPTLLFTQAPGGEQGPMRGDVLTLYRWGKGLMGRGGGFGFLCSSAELFMACIQQIKAMRNMMEEMLHFLKLK